MRKVMLTILALVAFSQPVQAYDLMDEAIAQSNRRLEAQRIDRERWAQEYNDQQQQMRLERDMRQLQLEQDRLRYELDLHRSSGCTATFGCPDLW